MKKLSFNVPFSAFASTTFINCFSSVYMYNEGMCGEDGFSTYCNEWEKGKCNSCGNCATKPQAMQEKFFFLFDMACGHSSLRCRFDGSRTEPDMLINGGVEADGENCFYDGGSNDNINFLFGFAGYAYKTIIDKAIYNGEIHSAIDSGKPVIAKLNGKSVPFCVITGYDGESYLMPNFKAAQNPPEIAPTDDEIDALYIMGEKTPQKYSLLEAFKRIEKVWAYNNKNKLWNSCTSHICTYGDTGIKILSPEQRKERMGRIAKIMWHTFNIHNFSEVFRCYTPGREKDAELLGRIEGMDKLRSPEIAESIGQIGGWMSGYSHDLAWSLIGLDECIKWDDWKSFYYGDMIELVICKLAENDSNIYNEIKKIIDFFEK